MNLYLIRHGRSVANDQKLVTGSIRDELTSQGVNQVADLKKWIKGINLEGSMFVTSQWKRAQQTADILWPEVEWTIDSSIGETNAGSVREWELNHFLRQHPDFYKTPSASYPDGESHDQLNDRVKHWLDNSLISTENNDNLIVVTHSGPISCLLQYVANVSMDNFPAFLPANASLSIIEFPENDLDKAAIKGFSLGTTNMISLNMVDTALE